MHMKDIKVIAFDADDTLWVNEPFFRSAEAKFELILETYLGKKDFSKELYKNEIENLHLFGYGAKGFMLAMIETALELTNYKISGEDIQKLINMGKEILSYKIDIYPTIKETLEYLTENNRYKVICITKGDLLDQESKVARSGLGEFFSEVHVVNEKNPETYKNILKKYKIKASEFLMIGNSLKSDILPVIKAGGSAIYIPQDAQWVHEIVDENQLSEKKYIEFKEAIEIKSIL